LRLIIFVILLLLFKFKAAYEEKQLRNKYPNYGAYKKTTGMFFPGI
jgi:protein-S-isoprenylcysteine O-methyltransferase Ste14